MALRTLPAVVCERCAGPMKRVRSLPKIGSLPELVTFRCEQCQHVDTRPVEPT